MHQLPDAPAITTVPSVSTAPDAPATSPAPLMVTVPSAGSSMGPPAVAMPQIKYAARPGEGRLLYYASSLKRIFVIECEGLAMYSDPKYIHKIMSVLGIQNPWKRKVPTSPEWCTEDHSALLDDHHHGLYRMAVGGLLYIAPDRCDVQFGVSMLARKVQSPIQRET